MSYVHPDGAPEVRVSRYVQDGLFTSLSTMKNDLRMSDATVRSAVNLLVSAGVLARTYTGHGAVLLEFVRKIGDETPRQRRARLVSDAQKALAAADQAVRSLAKVLDDR